MKTLYYLDLKQGEAVKKLAVVKLNFLSFS